MKGDLAEILIIGSAVTASDRAAIDNYLAIKYGILFGPPPTISIVRTAPNMVTLSWPTPNVTFLLEATADLAAPAWTTITDPVTSSGGTNSISLGALDLGKFYRLRKP